MLTSFSSSFYSRASSVLYLDSLVFFARLNHICVENEGGAKEEKFLGGGKLPLESWDQQIFFFLLFKVFFLHRGNETKNDGSWKEIFFMENITASRHSCTCCYERMDFVFASKEADVPNTIELQCVLTQIGFWRKCFANFYQHISMKFWRKGFLRIFNNVYWDAGLSWFLQIEVEGWRSFFKIKDFDKFIKFLKFVKRRCKILSTCWQFFQ